MQMSSRKRTTTDKFFDKPKGKKMNIDFRLTESEFVNSPFEQTTIGFRDACILDPGCLFCPIRKGENRQNNRIAGQLSPRRQTHLQ
jgi:hypothetical protein